jgi:hypothetical protein
VLCVDLPVRFAERNGAQGQQIPAGQQGESGTVHHAYRGDAYSVCVLPSVSFCLRFLSLLCELRASEELTCLLHRSVRAGHRMGLGGLLLHAFSAG